MKIIVGLGNPGRKYERTRHNVGFMVVDELANNLHSDIAQEKYFALIGKARIDSEQVVLVKPQTYMNESGRAVAAAVRGSYADESDLLVVHDELDLPTGSVRVKIGGGHGGHNGLRSIIEHLGSAEFVRVRIGISRPAPDRDTADYVLSPFLAEEREAAAKAISRAAEAVNVILKEGSTAAMNKFNQR
ncbi:MAG TPA: aminoacyl-tRNA hydrolase [Nitrospirota bacterium]|nr:aminoacyl-tRNA hydrolase [Nitrospirota bacterium]